ncbi:MAG TPA: RNA methyltransferase [Casimicrobiaceae bacterium]|nr:RNA methyltransferase [Casimicrobiaceae bacterium]
MSTDSISPLDRVRVVLVKTTHPGNIGATARAMFTMGLMRLVLVAPRSFPDADATARASGATEVLDHALVVDSLQQALHGCTWSLGLSARPRELAAQVLPMRVAALRIIQHANQGDVAIVFGTEMSGLSNDELSLCSAIATIPSNPRYASLNLAAAVQVAAYELHVTAFGGEVWRAPRFPSASHDETEALYAHAQRTLVALRFLDPALPRRLMPRLRRLFGRAGLEREEVNILRGVLARIDALLDDKRRD